MRFSRDARRGSSWLTVAAFGIVAAACSSSGASAVAPSSAAAATSPAASAAEMQVMSTGTFHDVDGNASGTVQLVVTPDGRYEVVFEDFHVESAAHTNVVLVSNADVTSSADIDQAKLLDLGPLTGTEGMQEYTIPADMAARVMDGYHSVVIWDTEMAHAVGAAPLT